MSNKVKLLLIRFIVNLLNRKKRIIAIILAISMIFSTGNILSVFGAASTTNPSGTSSKGNQNIGGGWYINIVMFENAVKDDVSRFNNNEYKTISKLNKFRGVSETEPAYGGDLSATIIKNWSFAFPWDIYYNNAQDAYVVARHQTIVKTNKKYLIAEGTTNGKEFGGLRNGSNVIQWNVGETPNFSWQRVYDTLGQNDTQDTNNGLIADRTKFNEAYNLIMTSDFIEKDAKDFLGIFYKNELGGLSTMLNDTFYSATSILNQQALYFYLYCIVAKAYELAYEMPCPQSYRNALENYWKYRNEDGCDMLTAFLIVPVYCDGDAYFCRSLPNAISVNKTSVTSVGASKCSEVNKGKDLSVSNNGNAKFYSEAIKEAVFGNKSEIVKDSANKNLSTSVNYLLSNLMVSSNDNSVLNGSTKNNLLALTVMQQLTNSLVYGYPGFGFWGDYGMIQKSPDTPEIRLTATPKDEQVSKGTIVTSEVKIDISNKDKDKAEKTLEYFKSKKIGDSSFTAEIIITIKMEKEDGDGSSTPIFDSSTITGITNGDEYIIKIPCNDENIMKRYIHPDGSDHEITLIDTGITVNDTVKNKYKAKAHIKWSDGSTTVFTATGKETEDAGKLGEQDQLWAYDYTNWTCLPEKLYYYGAIQTGYAEIKQGYPYSGEEFEAMAGTPTTRDQYVSFGASNFGVNMEVDYKQNPATQRKYTINIKMYHVYTSDEPCKWTETSHSFTCTNQVDDGNGGTKQCGSTVSKKCSELGSGSDSVTCPSCSASISTSHTVPDRCGYECPDCGKVHNDDGYNGIYCQVVHNENNQAHSQEPTQTYTITQEIDSFSYMDITGCELWMLDKAMYEGNEDLFKEANIEIDPGLGYDYFVNQEDYTSGNGRLLFDSQFNIQKEDSFPKYKSSNTDNWGDTNLEIEMVYCTKASDGYPEVKEKMLSEANIAKGNLGAVTATAISDYLVLKTTEGYQHLLFHFLKSNSANMPTENFTDSVVSLEADKITFPVMPTKEDMWDNNNRAWDTAKHTDKDIVYSGYNSKYKTPSKKMVNNNKHTEDNNGVKYQGYDLGKGETNSSGYFTPQPNSEHHNNGEFNMTFNKDFDNTALLYTGLDIIDATTPPPEREWSSTDDLVPVKNGEWDTGHTYIQYKKVLTYETTDGTKWDSYENKTEVMYSDAHDKVNNIVVHNPTSVQYATVLANPKQYDQRTEASLLEGSDPIVEIKGCPNNATCIYQSLTCPIHSGKEHDDSCYVELQDMSNCNNVNNYHIHTGECGSGNSSTIIAYGNTDFYGTPFKVYEFTADKDYNKITFYTRYVSKGDAMGCVSRSSSTPYFNGYPDSLWSASSSKMGDGFESTIDNVKKGETIYFYVAGYNKKDGNCDWEICYGDIDSGWNSGVQVVGIPSVFNGIHLDNVDGKSRVILYPDETYQIIKHKWGSCEYNGYTHIYSVDKGVCLFCDHKCYGDVLLTIDGNQSTCTGEFNVHNHVSSCYGTKKVLACKDPHHYEAGSQNWIYDDVKNHYSYGDSRCWSACNNDSKHNKPSTVKLPDGQELSTQDIFINLDREFTVYYPNIGDFAMQPDLWGISNCTDTLGKGYTDNMNVSEWLREKLLYLPVNVIINDKMYLAGEPINILELPIVVENNGKEPEDYKYTFYCVLGNSEYRNAEVKFHSIANNAVEQKEYLDNDYILNKERFSNHGARHTAWKTQPIDVVGYIGGLTINDTGDLRFATLFKQPLNNNRFLIPNLVPEVDYRTPNKVLSVYKDVRQEDGRYTGYYQSPYGVTKMPTGGKGTEYELLPLTPYRNNIKALGNQDMRPGYKLYMDIETVGNYYGINVDENGIDVDTNLTYKTQIIPKYYALNLDNNDYIPVDVYMYQNGAYKPVVLFNSNDTSEWYYYLEWLDEADRRNFTVDERDALAEIQKYFREVSTDEDNPNGTYLRAPTEIPHLQGTASALHLNSLDRTFIGSSTTYGEDMNPGNRLDELSYIFQSQRWHFTLGLPSSSVFIEADKPCTDINIKQIQDNNYVIVCLLDIKSRGDVWTLQYDGSAVNYSYDEDGDGIGDGFKIYKDIPDDDGGNNGGDGGNGDDGDRDKDKPYIPPTEPDGTPTKLTIITTFNKKFTSEDDLRTEGTH